jgi:hypothetical protein
MRFSVEKNAASITFRAVMKYLWMLAILAIACVLSACASTGTTAAGDPVPGEKTGEESRLQPGAGTTPSATLKW